MWKLAIDMGSSMTKIYRADTSSGIVLAEPSCVAVVGEERTVKAVGKEAKNLIGKTADNYLDLVALATIADSMPLLGENRDLVYEGLNIIKRLKSKEQTAKTQIIFLNIQFPCNINNSASFVYSYSIISNILFLIVNNITYFT